MVRFQFALPPAPKVTLIKSGFNSQRTARVSSIFFNSLSFLGGKISSFYIDICGDVVTIHDRGYAKLLDLENYE